MSDHTFNPPSRDKSPSPDIPSTPEKRKTFISINLLRGVSVLLVVIYHYTTRMADRVEVPQLAATAGWEFMLPWGCAAVVTFFMMSGFLIGGYFLNKRTSAPAYLVNRAIRLYPTYWGGMFITYGLLLLLYPEGAVGIKSLLYNLTMIPAALGQPRVDGAYWTMQIEFFFSFLVGILLIFSGFRTRRWLLLLWMATAVSLYFLPSGNPLLTALRFFAIPRYAHTFIAGTAAYLLLNNCRKPEVWLLLIVCCANQILYAETLAHTIFFFVTLLVFLFTNRIDTLFERKEFAPLVSTLTFFATISYSWYLCHQMIGVAILSQLMSRGYDSEWIILIPTALTFLLAILLNRLVELPTARLGKRLSSRLRR